MVAPLTVLLIHIMLNVLNANQELEPNTEKVPEYAGVQHDTPLPYREVEEPVDVVVVEFDLINVDDEYHGDVNVG